MDDEALKTIHPMRFILIILLFILEFNLVAQQKYWVYFSDKNCNSEPALSERALERRRRQSIPLDKKDDQICQTYFDQLSSMPGLRVLTSSKWLNAVSVEVQDQQTRNLINAASFVRKIEPVQKYTRTHEILQSDQLQKTDESTFYPAQYGFSYNQIKMMNVNALHEYGYMGKDMLIAVFDAGFQGVDTGSFFQTLYDEHRMVYTHNVVNPTEDVYRYSSHGTNVLSLMAAFKENQYIGTAPDASYCLFVTEDVSQEMPVEEDNWLKAMEIADSLGADVINSSLGYTDFNDTLLSHTYANMDGNTTIITKAADIAASKGILVVTSAGNEGNSSWKYISAPADADSVLTVGSVNNNQHYSSFSSIGPTYDGRLKPNVVAQGEKPFVVTHVGTITNGGSGTSFASPLIAGAVACLWQSAPYLSNMEIIHAVEQHASQSIFPDNTLGFGVPDFLKSYYALHPTDTLPLKNDVVDVFPNPFSNQIYLRYFSTTDQSLNIEIHTLQGQILLEKTATLYKGFNEVLIEDDVLLNIRKGLYTMQLQTDSLHKTYKVLKQF